MFAMLAGRPPFRSGSLPEMLHKQRFEPAPPLSRFVTGIPPEVKEKMFNPFFTTKPAGEGTGLGLSMSHDIIVKQHGGTIDVASEPGIFTEFTVVLPRSKNISDKARG